MAMYVWRCMCGYVCVAMYMWLCMRGCVCMYVCIFVVMLFESDITIRQKLFCLFLLFDLCPNGDHCFDLLSRVG